jgi:heme oxygenase (biliverdin-IX-beta and delta-forming)
MSAISREAAALVRAQRWAALATLDAGEPLASMVAYAIEAGGGALLFHLSQLAQHTRNLIAHAGCSLAISEPDTLEGDPQRLDRVVLVGAAAVLERTDEDYSAAAEAYVARFPDAQMRFELGDFLLVRFTPDTARYVGGFARAARFAWAEIMESGVS